MKLAFFNELEAARTILIAGAGGGFDVFAGLPLYFWLRNQGKSVHLANLSFTDLRSCKGERPVPSLMRVLPDTRGTANYFPELYLSHWLSDRWGETPVYAIERSGARPVLAAYDWMVRTLAPETILLVDGGTDSLMRGDEHDLGTPQEDAVSLYAANAVSGVARKCLLSVGFGIDTYHGISHGLFLENAAALIADGGYLGAWTMTRDMEEFRLYQEAYKFASSEMARRSSIVNSSIIAAVNGRFGDHHSTDRTEGSTLFINPLMAIYWSFSLEHVARRNLYLDELARTDLYIQVTTAIQKFRGRLSSTRPRIDIPC